MCLQRRNWRNLMEASTIRSSFVFGLIDIDQTASFILFLLVWPPWYPQVAMANRLFSEDGPASELPCMDCLRVEWGEKGCYNGEWQLNRNSHLHCDSYDTRNMWLLWWDPAITSLEISRASEEEKEGGGWWQELRRCGSGEGGDKQKAAAAEETQSAWAGHGATCRSRAQSGEKTREEKHADVIWLSGDPQAIFLWNV